MKIIKTLGLSKGVIALILLSIGAQSYGDTQCAPATSCKGASGYEYACGTHSPILYAKKDDTKCYNEGCTSEIVASFPAPNDPDTIKCSF
jgi:hypothetical protein